MTEHRDGGGTFHNLKGFMEGGEQLEQLQESLLKKERHKLLLEEIENILNKDRGKTIENN